MGFRPQSKTFLVKFDPDHELHGLEMRTRSVSIGAIRRILRAAGAGADGRKPSVDDVEAVEQLFDEFGGALIDWNLEHPVTGDPVEASADGLRSLDFDFVTTLAMSWVDAVIGAAAPLGKSSPGGGRFPEASLPMAPRSSSRAS